MNAQHELIFRQAMASKNREGILRVAQAFHGLGEFVKAKSLYRRAYSFGFAFGAMARGTPIDGTDGAVIPPGRYWIDLIGDNREKFKIFYAMKPEVTVEKIEHADSNRDFAIFIIPPFASNYGMAGVLFPTKVLGFPTIADASIHTSADTVQRPPPMTYTEAAKEVAGTAGKAIGTTVKAGSTGLAAGLGVSPTTLWLGAGAAALIALKVLFFL